MHLNQQNEPYCATVTSDFSYTPCSKRTNYHHISSITKTLLFNNDYILSPYSMHTPESTYKLIPLRFCTCALDLYGLHNLLRHSRCKRKCAFPSHLLDTKHSHWVLATSNTIMFCLWCHKTLFPGIHLTCTMLAMPTWHSLSPDRSHYDSDSSSY
jgi:hypothetical protein